jgi:hypothetical protein
MSFIRKIESFSCSNCGHFVEGNGYTNHCPVCLWSLHVDNNPGDRQNQCLGKMKPIDFIFKNGSVDSILHKCQTCGIEKKNKISEQDSQTEIIKQIKQISESKTKGIKR